MALALQGLPAADQSELLALGNNQCLLDDQQRLREVRRLYDKANVFETAMKLVDKHQMRAEEVADEIEVEGLRRLLYFLVDTVLERPELPAPVVVSLGVNAPIS